MATVGFTHKLTKGYNTDMGTLTAVAQTFTGNAQSGLFVDVPAGATNQVEILSVNRAKVISLCLATSKAPVTIKTNSSSAPQDTINIVSPSYPAMIEWDSSQTSVANPFSGDVTSVYLTNSSATLTTIHIEVLLTD